LHCRRRVPEHERRQHLRPRRRHGRGRADARRAGRRPPPRRAPLWRARVLDQQAQLREHSLGRLLAPRGRQHRPHGVAGH
ncbi:hypothetical protein BN1708_019093, partial [Verticillium longisporum]